MRDLFKRTDVDIMTIKRVEPDFPDEWAIRSAAYHLQQANEKMLKSYISLCGVRPPYTHDIGQLIMTANDNNIFIPVTTQEVAMSLTYWQAKTRYDPSVYFRPEDYQKGKQSFQELKELVVDKLLEIDLIPAIQAFVENGLQGEYSNGDFSIRVGENADFVITYENKEIVQGLYGTTEALACDNVDDTIIQKVAAMADEEISPYYGQNNSRNR